MRKAGLIFFSTLVSAGSVFASSPNYGSYLSVQLTQQLLAAPPLPGLEGARKTLSPIAGFMTASPVETATSSDGTQANVTAGSFQGLFGGLGYTTASKGDLTYFFFGIASTLAGEMLAKETTGFNSKDIVATGIGMVGGASYRLLGDKTSMTGFGVFGGPGL